MSHLLVLARRIRTSNSQVFAILGNASSMLAATAVTSLLGFVYWWFAANQFSVDNVGVAAASVSSMMLLGTVSALGLGTLLMGEVSRHPGKERALAGTALIVSGSVGALFGGGFALISPLLSEDLSPLRSSPFTVLLFAAGVAMTSQSIVADQALLGFLRGDLQLWRNGVFAVSKLLILIVLALSLTFESGLNIFATWVLGSALSLSFLFIATRAWRNLRSFLVVNWELVRNLRNQALGHHLVNIAINVPSLALPLVAAIVMTARESALTYTTFLVAGLVFVPPYALSMGLFSIGARSPRDLPRLMRFGLIAAVCLNVAAVIFIWISAELILGFFGEEYSEEASWALRIAVLGSFALMIKDNYVVVSRVQGRLFTASVWLILGSLIELGGAVIGGLISGMQGLALGWVLGLHIEALIFGPRVIRTALSRGAEPTD